MITKSEFCDDKITLPKSLKAFNIPEFGAKSVIRKKGPVIAFGTNIEEPGQRVEKLMAL